MTKILTILGDTVHRELGEAIESGVAKFAKENNVEVASYDINAADLSIGYGKALVTVQYSKKAVAKKGK